ncbi:MAG: hypothetical protein C4551_08230 [Bacillota bacterium]|nr:MAG: hypothetical protein C4551_08230 [Bacillota bacterium]
MVHHLVPRALYEHPVVEYIPLEVVTLASGAMPPSGRGPWDGFPPALVALRTAADWQAATQAYPFARDVVYSRLRGAESTQAPNRLAFLAVGFRVEAGIYRGSKASLATSGAAQVYQIFTLPSKYFYKPRVTFVAYTPLGAELAQARDVEVGDRSSRAGAPVPGNT